MSKAMFNTPNLLCYFRIAIIPFMIALYYWDSAFAAWTNVILITLAGASDYFDGRIARATGQTTLLGKFLDSSTDKLVVTAALVMLVEIGRIDGAWTILVVIILLREITISGIREFLAMQNVIVPISMMGKWKLTVQMIALGFLTAGEYGRVLVPHNPVIAKVLLLFAAIITVISGLDYLREGIRTMQKLDSGEKL